MTRLKYFALITLPTILFTFLVLELVFRLVIPASDPPHAYYDANEQIFRLDVNGPRTGTHTVGKLAEVRGEWRINNHGWNSEVDYSRTKSDRLRVAVIGDSFIAALQVAVEDSIPGRLREQIGDEIDVYSFGTSGAPMSQYLQMSRYVNRNFDPDILVFNIVENDFDESLCEVSRPLGMLCLGNTEGRVTESRIIPYTPSSIRRLARNSSLVRYLFLNLHLSSRFERTASQTQPPLGGPGGNSTDAGRRNRVAAAVDYTLRTIAAENPENTIIFMMDAPRLTLYDEQPTQPDEITLWRHELLRDVTSRYGFYYIDLTEEFREKFEQDGERFEFPQDTHWNEAGHAVAAAALLKALQDIDACCQTSVTPR